MRRKLGSTVVSEKLTEALVEHQSSFEFKASGLSSLSASPSAYVSSESLKRRRAVHRE